MAGPAGAAPSGFASSARDCDVLARGQNNDGNHAPAPAGPLAGRRGAVRRARGIEDTNVVVLTQEKKVLGSNKFGVAHFSAR